MGYTLACGKIALDGMAVCQRSSLLDLLMMSRLKVYAHTVTLSAKHRSSSNW
jgi:hypothetical protein